MVVSQYSLNQIRNEIKTGFTNTYSHGAVGNGTTPPTTTDTTLSSEDYREAFFDESSNTTEYIASIFLDSTENNGNTIAETGVFDASSGGNMLLRSLTNSINKDSDTEVFVEYKITINVVNS